MAERIHWWTERWLELCFLEWLQWSPHPQLLNVVWCSVVVEPTFRPSGTPKHWEKGDRDFSNFLRTCIFFLMTLSSSLIFVLLLFSSQTLPPLAFSSGNIIGNFDWNNFNKNVPLLVVTHNILISWSYIIPQYLTICQMRTIENTEGREGHESYPKAVVLPYRFPKSWMPSSPGDGRGSNNM